MANTPQFYGPDGVLRSEYIFSTDISTRFFRGTTDPDTVDIQVSIRGGGFTSDPDSIIFEGTEFTIPNPSAFPAGLELYPGDNIIEVRAVLSNGETTAVGTVNARLALDRDVKAGILAPSGVSIEKRDHTVQIMCEGLVDSNVVGYHFYASTDPGGGTAGYFRINPEMVVSSNTTEETDELGDLTVDATVATNADGEPAADPLYLNVIGQQVDRIGTVFQTDYNQAFPIPEVVTHLKTTVTVESVRRVQMFSFTHDRRSTTTSSDNPAIPNSAFLALPDQDPLYYVVTAVYLIGGDEYESVFSPELAAAPLIITPTLALLPPVTHQQVVRDTALALFRSQPELDIKPGAPLRDTFIDPFATEAERIRFVLGFVQAAQSFSSLLAIDDPGNSGTSLPVNQSPYKVALKQAFFLQSDADTQLVIDNAFDALAARRGAVRRTGYRARGEVTAYMTTQPTTTQQLVIGMQATGGGINFRLTSAGAIAATGAGTTYNPQTGRYSTRVFIQAEDAGEAGNLAPGQIKSLLNGPPGVQVVNEGYTFGGRNAETNRELATRADGLLSAVDSGTYRGYVQTTIDVPGVRQVNVVDAGHALMMRDWDSDYEKHTGGKVDVWCRGESLATLTDGFAFRFDFRFNQQFEPVGDIQNLQFRAIDDALSDDNPLIEMLDNPDWDFVFEDHTTGFVFDLTDVQVIAPDGIQLSQANNDPVNISLTDVFRGSYRYRTSNKHIFTRQPVREIVTFAGDPTRSGVIDPSAYRLFTGLPLLMGRSSEAGDYVQVVVPTDGTEPIEVPSGDPIVVTGEEHVILEGPEYLNSLGANKTTVRIYTVDRVTEYYGPFHPGDVQDFTFLDEEGENPLAFVLTDDSRIEEGTTVIVDYQHDENFVVTYQSNALVAVAQNAIRSMRHVTADVLVKDALPTGVDISGTIVMVKGKSKDVVDSAVRTNLSRLFGAVSLGQPLRQSDIIGVIEQATDVSYVVTPLVKMAKTDGSMVVREVMRTGEDTDVELITAWSSDLVKVYLLGVDVALESGTIDGGGSFNEPRGVFRDEVAFTLFDTPPNYNGVPLKYAAMGAYIIGNDGLNIPGFSDDATLAAEYPLASGDELDTLRQQITARRVLVTVVTGDDPTTNEWTVTYMVYGDTGVKNIEPGPTEYLQLGDLDFSYDEDTDFSALVKGRRGN